MARSYRMNKRAERQDETRQRIVEAAVQLHQTIGPAATTFTDIARLADVGRVTVYRHFADEASLARACSGHYFAQHPPPDPERWASIAEPGERLRAALTDSYRYHRSTEAMMTRALADSREHPVMRPYHAHWRRAADVLTTPFRARGRRRTLLRAAIGLAISFDTWRTLVRDQGLADDQAVDVAMRLALEPPPTRRG
ncbi:MAG TPA: TetR family transcriptional regulator [Jatrophihabitantaceae bacterium]|jgi:AcrR family transcriptional regulator